jgi:peptidoglycan glycosyltransferase
MNRQIARLSLIATLLILVLAVFTARWSVIDATALKNEPLNRRPLLEQQQIPRGLILARDNSKIAENRHVGTHQNKRYYRVYPQNNVFSHAAGYAFVSRGSSGLEQSQNDVLSGTAGDLGSFFDEIAGGPSQGDDIKTALDPEAQKTAISALAGRQGAIVAMDPRSGAVQVMASQPDYNPNDIPAKFAELNRQSNSPLFNRATQGQYPPGSTFKVVTAAAGLDSGKYTPDSQISGKNNKVISGVPLQNFGGENFASISLTDALTHSVNTVFGEMGEKLGKKTMFDYMTRFGFNAKPPLDYPRSQMFASGEYKNGKLLDANSPSVDVGRMAIGQDKLQVTPLQMAMVASAVANDGKLMRPHMVEKVVGPDGRTKDTIGSDEQSRVMSEKSASELNQMMRHVVESGTGTAAQLQGIQVAGKTGTAEAPGGFNDAWFIAFAPADNPKVAVAVVVEHAQQSQTGGEVAAPLAAQVMRVLLRRNG